MAKAEYRSAIRSRKLITQALVDLLDEKPLEKITVTDIVKQADINRGTFYAHYESVEGVVVSIFENAYAVIRNALTEYTTEERPNPALMLNQLQIVLEQDLEFYRKIFSSDVSLYIYEHITAEIMSYVLEQEEALATSTTHEDFLFYTSFYSGGIIKLYRDWFAGKLPFSFDALTEKASQELKELQEKVYS